MTTLVPASFPITHARACETHVKLYGMGSLRGRHFESKAEEGTPAADHEMGLRGRLKFTNDRPQLTKKAMDQ